MKRRLDVYLVEEGIISGRDLAKSIIMEGKVFVNNQKADKAGMQIGDKDTVEVRGHEQKYVSRGGLKLEKAMAVFPVSLKGKTAMDIGASTGGFTDCMLQNGAVKVFAVDVGYGQLAWKLRTDERVVNMERTNIRNVTLKDIGQPLDFASVDVAFISLELVLPVAKTLLKEGGELVFSTFGKENFREIYHLMGTTLKYYSTDELAELFPESDICPEIHIMAFKDAKEVLKHLQLTGVNAIESKIWTKKDLIQFENGYRNLCITRPTLTYNPVYIYFPYNI